jgi:predicted patatin/cPLA2 family phospholipase
LSSTSETASPARGTASEIVALLRARVERGSRAPHGDGASIALAVEGGGMRGVVSAGMVTALEALGYTNAFDAVYGSSAGAVNAAYFLAGQAGTGTTIYFEDINGPQFISLRRAVTPRPILDLAFLLDDVVVRRKRLAIDRVLASASPLSVLATDVESRTSAVFRAFADGASLLGALRAGATMPIVAGGPREYGGRRYLDASLSEPIPVPTAERDGHTHVLTLLTRSGPMRPRASAFDRYFVGPRLRRISPELADRYLTRAAPYAELMARIDAGTGPMGRARVMAVRVQNCRVSKLECRADVLRRAAGLGAQAIHEIFGVANPQPGGGVRETRAGAMPSIAR